MQQVRIVQQAKILLPAGEDDAALAVLVPFVEIFMKLLQHLRLLGIAHFIQPVEEEQHTLSAPEGLKQD